MDMIPPKAKTRSRRRNLAGSIRTGIHTVTIQMRKPSRYVPLMVAMGIGAFVSFGYPLVSQSEDPHVQLDDAALGQLVAVHRGLADRSKLVDFTRVKALLHFETLPAARDTGVQGSLVVLRESRVVSAEDILTAFNTGGTYVTAVDGISVQVRRHEGALHVLIDANLWPHIALPEPS